MQVSGDLKQAPFDLEEAVLMSWIMLSPLAAQKHIAMAFLLYGPTFLNK